MPSGLFYLNCSDRSISSCEGVSGYNECPKILYIKVSDKMACADSADPDQTAEWVDSSTSAVQTGPFPVERVSGYDECPKVLYTKVSDKMACVDSADPDQTAPEGAVWSGSTLFAILLII